MHVVILAAGRGSRFEGQELPKALLPIYGGGCLLEHQLANLLPHTPLNSIHVVVGFRQERLRQQFPQLHFVDNPRFATENTAKSLLCALESIDIADDLLWLNGDVVFRSTVLKKLLREPRSSMLVNCAPVGEEEVKYRADEMGRIVEVSKQTIHGAGEALGLNFFCRADLPQLKAALEECKPMDYFEAAIQICISRGVDVWAVPVDDIDDCVEIDFPADLERANQHLRRWSAK